MNASMKKACLRREIGDKRGFEATAALGRAIAREVRGSQT